MNDRPEILERYPAYHLRLLILGGAMLIAMSALCLRLWNLQVVEGPQWQEQAREYRLYAQPLNAQRGLMYADLDGEPVLIAENRPAFDVMMVRGEDQEYIAAARRAGDILGIGQTDVDRVIEALAESSPYKQVLLARDVSRTNLLRLEEEAYRLPGVFTHVRSMRRYPFGETGGQLLGYVGAISDRELETFDDRYRRTDLVGKAGLEAVYEPIMRGRDGRTLVNVHRVSGWLQPRTDVYGNLYFNLDRYGNTLDEEVGMRVEPAQGEAVYTTLDVGLQRFCEELLSDVVGAIAVIDARNGAVLALASSPGYDPSVFVQAGRSAERKALFAKKPNPMRNRCYQEIYPPGSTYKVALAAAAIEEGIVDKNTTHYCPGYFRLGPGIRPWRCHQRGGHGTVNMDEALAYSCDVFFYHVGYDLGVERIKHWSTQMGLGVKTGIDLTGEAEGIIPDPEWRRAIMKKLAPDDPSEWNWYPGHTINLSIGQGDATITPLQTAVMTACIINGGYRVTPHLNHALDHDPPPRVLKPETAEAVARGMLLCVDKDYGYPQGTGRRAKIEGIEILGKTGTAEMMSGRNQENYETEEDIPYDERDHAWFVCGVQHQEPPVAISVLIEHGLHGGSVASPYGKAVIEYMYGDQVAGPPVQVAQGPEE